MGTRGSLDPNKPVLTQVTKTRERKPGWLLEQQMPRTRVDRSRPHSRRQKNAKALGLRQKKIP